MEAVKTPKLHRIVHGTGAHGGHSLIPELLQVGWGKFTVAYPEHLAPHHHDGAFEICLILAGEVEWETEDQSYLLRSGDLFVTRPNELHWGRDSAMQPCTLFWMHLDEDSFLAGWSAPPSLGGAGLRELLHRVPRQLQGGSARLGSLFQSIFDEHHGEADDALKHGLRQLSARAALQQLVVELVRLSDEIPEPHQEGDIPDIVERAIEIIRAASQESLSNRDIAASVGASVAVLNELFVHHLGISLTQFSLRERVRVARAKLGSTQQSVTDIANELGFSSSQHFATAFKRMTGISPSSYRAANSNTH